MNPLIILIAAQILYTGGDMMARLFIPHYGFTWALAGAPIVWLYFAMRLVATAGQLYVLANFQLGQSAALFGAASIILANILSILVLREALSPVAYLGVALAIIAFLIIAMR
ncbi:MAG TPA: hypothetical protein VGP13_00050 [Candidatus Paceibacterota bacterium]|jgi:uncharacterized membrane protein|nr:hypothetical protein [Candidatus Paceibacterota bacterium]